jgi:hypothetical protein
MRALKSVLILAGILNLNLTKGDKRREEGDQKSEEYIFV